MLRILACVCTLLAVSALADADPPKPRVMVILDTSRSMTEKPKFDQDTDRDHPILMTEPGGDYDSSKDPVCANKFCTAKKVLHEVIPQYTEDARIGLSTYFQYVMRATTPSTESTTCLYDVLAPKNGVRQFSSLIDFTGSGSTVCSGGPTATCSSSTRATTFPDQGASGGSGAGLYGICKTPSDYSRVSDVSDLGDTCSSQNCYEVTKTAANASTSVTCSVYTKPSSISVPNTYGSPCTSVKYTSASSTVSTVNVGVAVSASSCSGTVVAPTTSPSGSPALILSTTPTTSCSTWSVGCVNSTSTLQCSSSLPCDLFLTSSTPVKQSSDFMWFGLFDPSSFTPSASTSNTGSPSYTFSARTTTSSYLSAALSGARHAVASCLPTGLYSGGETTDGTFGVTNAAASLAANATIGSNSKADQTPTLSGANYTCSSTWPCSVTLANDTTNAATWAAGPTIYNTTGLDTSTWRVVGSATTKTYTARATSPSVTSCATLATTTSPTVAPTNMTWDSTPTGCGSGANYVCTFSSGTTGSVTAPSGTCESVTSYVSSAAPTCSFNGKSYGTPTTTSITGISKTILATASCASGTFTVNGVGDGYSGVPAYPASVTYVNETTGTPQTSAATVDITAVPSGYSGSPAIASDRGTPTYGTKTASSANLCVGGAVAGDTIQSSDATLCAGMTPCTLVVKGMKQTSSNGCGTESDPCNQCEYQPRQYQWQLATTQCNYSATKYVSTVDRTAMTCSYTRDEWATEQAQPPTHDCQYTLGATRYDFTQSTSAYCEYFAVQTALVAPRTLYTYQYLTKGNEIIGRASKSVPGNSCSATWSSSNDFGLACPETVDCSTLTSVTSKLTAAGISELAASTCVLHYGGSATSSSAKGTNNGRYSNCYSSSSTGTGSTGNFDTVASSGSRACEASTSTPSSPDSYKSTTSSPTGFCSSSGLPAVDTYSLVSDWYDPSTSNSISVWSSTYGSSAVLSWYNTPTKAQGFSAAIGTATTGSGALPVRSVFVPIPNDSSYSSSAQKTALMNAVDKCILPGDDGGTPTDAGELRGGACISNAFNPSAPDYQNQSDAGWQDMTPLYGSLESTKEYLTDRWQNDDDAQDCRDYFIVLATDGLERTPKGYTLTGADPSTSVEALVASFRNTSNQTPKTRPDIKTFVIGFGEGAAGAGGLDSVAAAGGTSHAFSATSLTELETALQAVFTTITQGTFSRSKPALGTDGKRLYAAQYIKPSKGADWSGLLTAYRVSDVDGSFSMAWEWSQKLNDHTAQPSRDIAIGLRKQSDGSKIVQDFANSGEVANQLTSRWDYSSTGSTQDLIDFIREAGHPYEDGALRSSAAGPVVMSNPIVVAKSPFDIDYGGSSTDEKNAFNTFVTSTASRGTRVMFTSNDGMVHSLVESSTATACTTEADVNCPNGTEAWAFIPGSLELGYDSLHGRPTLAQTLFKLKTGAWGLSLLDNSLSVADVCDNGSGHAENCASSDWRTIAIGTQRGGGRGVVALDITNNAKPDTSHFLWDFFDGDLGFTYSVPAVGRVRLNGHDQFIAVFGGGFDDSGSNGFLDVEGLNVFVLNAVSGDLVEKFSTYQVGAFEWFFSEQAVARPALYRRPSNAYIDTAYVPVGHALYAMRFAKSNGDQHNVSNKWKPDVLFNPLSSSNIELATCPTTPCGTAKVNKVVETVAGTSSAPPVYGLQAVQDLPLSSAPSIHNRPKVSAQLVPSGSNADLYVGTGDIRNPQHPDPEFSNANYFYAVHDFNEQNHGTENDGKPLWVVQFPVDASGRPEQVVSEPAIISGCIVVATYTPPVASAGCALVGDTTLYGFNPVDGSLKQCLLYTSASQYAGSSTAVVKLAGVGVPSDLVVVNDNVYFASSKDGLQKAPVKPSPQAGEVRSYRRLR